MKSFYQSRWLVLLAVCLASGGVAAYFWMHEQALHVQDERNALTILFGSLLIASVLVVAATSSWWIKR